MFSHLVWRTEEESTERAILPSLRHEVEVTIATERRPLISHGHFWMCSCHQLSGSSSRWAGLYGVYLFFTYCEVLCIE